MDRMTQNLISGQPWTFGGNLERDIYIGWKGKGINRKSKLLKKIVMKSLLLRKFTRERRIKRRHVEKKKIAVASSSIKLEI